jgi:transcriptional regulator with XRE-family HTH domain
MQKTSVRDVTANGLKDIPNGHFVNARGLPDMPERHKSQFLKDFGSRAERARHRLTGLVGWKVGQKHVGALLGVSQSAYGRWENGLKEPSLDTVDALAKILGVRLDWLVRGVGPMESEQSPTFPEEWERLQRATAERITPPASGRGIVVPRPASRGLEKKRRRAEG